jgi:hypothetical protein
VFFVKGNMRNDIIFQKSQPVETGHECLSSSSTGPLKNMDASPRTKTLRSQNTRKSLEHFEHSGIAMARTGRYEVKAPHKAGVGANHSRVQRGSEPPRPI